LKLTTGIGTIQSVFFYTKMSDLHIAAAAMVAKGKGVLAIDESTGTCKKRFDLLNVECSEENRRLYRQLLVTAPAEDYLSGMILFDETLRQKTDDGVPFPQVLSEKGILPGIKVDTGAHELALHAGEKVTEGLDGLRARLAEYKELGAKFAKWRAVITIDTEKNFPSAACYKANAHALARYAALCQEAGIVPMVEPEILYDGSHDMATCKKVSEEIWTTLFAEMAEQGVDMKGAILKTSFVLNGKTSGKENTAAEVAKETVDSFLKTVPTDLGGIVFLSGGLTGDESTAFLNEINKTYTDLPWNVSFSYGRGIQQDALDKWSGDSSAENVAAAQEILTARARDNGLASKGEY
jgi:fructose-bisphosphate aldolase class I